MAEHEAKGLQDGHQAKHNAGGTGRAGADRANEVGIRHVVDVGDQHGNNGRDTQ